MDIFPTYNFKALSNLSVKLLSMPGFYPYCPSLRGLGLFCFVLFFLFLLLLLCFVRQDTQTVVWVVFFNDSYRSLTPGTVIYHQISPQKNLFLLSFYNPKRKHLTCETRKRTSSSPPPKGLPVVMWEVTLLLSQPCALHFQAPSLSFGRKPWLLYTSGIIEDSAWKTIC